MLYRFLSVCLVTAVVSANPQGGVVVSGNASFESTDNSLTVNQYTQEAWIDWDSFSIGSEETVNINQLISEGLTVNRVTGNDLSEIFGQLNSNGTVYLINPNGILFSESSRVDVGGLFATDHWLSTDGTLTSASVSSAGVKVLGEIHSREELTLLSGSIENAGVLSANNVQLLGSSGALLHLDDAGVVSVLVPASNEESSWVKNTGAVTANGQVFLGSPHKNDWLNQLAAENKVSVSGDLIAQDIKIQGSSVDLIDAQLTAQLIDIESQSNTHIGQTTIQSNDGTVRIRGEDIQLHSHTSVDAGSGQLTIGGYFQGQDDDNNAQFVHVSSSVHLYGNGGTHGNGGEIILWSDGTTSFHGNIEAKGGVETGDGGFVEVSGKETLVFRGDVLTTASNGQMGLLLLDPDTITIADGAGASADTDGTVAPTDYLNQDITIYEADLEAIAAGTSINLQAEETISINDLTDGALTFNQTGSVQFQVSNSAGEARFEMLDTTDSIEMTGGGDLNIFLFGNTAIGSPGQTATMIVGDINFTSGGNLNLQATTQGAGITSDDITMSVEDITITGDGGVILAINNSEDLDVGLTRLDVGNITITGTAGTNNISLSARNNNIGSGVAGTSTLNLNGDINASGTGHTLSIQVEEDGAIGGTINSNGDITVPNGSVAMSATRWELNQSLIDLRTFNGANTPGGGFDLASIVLIDGNGNSLRLRGGDDFNNFDFTNLTGIDDLTFSLGADISLGNTGVGADITQTELGDLNGTVARLILESNGNITSDNVNTYYNTSLVADNNADGSGSVVLNGLVTNNGNLEMSGADISGNSTLTDTGSGTITINGAASQDISIVGTETFNIEGGVWTNFVSAQTTVVAGASSTIYWEGNTIGGDVTLDSSAGAGTVFQGGPFSFGGPNAFQLIGDTYITTDFAMTSTSSTLDIDGELFVGVQNLAGGDTVTVSGNWDTAGMTSVDLVGDAGDAATLTHILDTDFSLSNVTSTNSNNLDIFSDGSVTASNLSVGDLLISFDPDSDSSGASLLNLLGTNSVNGLTLTGSNVNDIATMGGDWTIGGDFNVFSVGTLNITSVSLSANEVNMTTLNNLSLGTGADFTLLATGGDISLAPNVTADRNTKFDASGTIYIRDITTTNDDVVFESADVEESVATTINLGTGQLSFVQDGANNNISIGDAGTETYNIESNIWNNITAGSLIIDASGNFDNITFLEDTLPANTTIDGSNGTLTFDGVAQNFVGTSLNTSTDVVFLQDFTSDSVVGITGAITIGASNASAGDILNIEGNWSIVSASGIDLLGDTGDTVNFVHSGNGFSPPAISSSNGNPDFVIDTRQGLTLSGFEGGNLTVNLDYNDNGGNAFVSSGNYSVNDLRVTGTLGVGSVRNESADIDGNWTIAGSADFINLSDVTFFNNNFIAGDDLHLGADTTITLGSSGTAFNLGSTTGYVSFGDLTGNRPLNITTNGGIYFGSINVASRDLSLSSNGVSPNSIQYNGAGTGHYIQAGDLTVAGDITWAVNPLLSGFYTQTRGNVILDNVDISGFGIDLTAADSLTLSGTANSLEARSGDVDLSNTVDDGSNASLDILATESVNLTNVNTGTGNLTVESDTNSSGTGTITLVNGVGGNLTLNSDAELNGTQSYTNLAVTDINLTAASFDSSDFGTVNFNGSSNTLTVSDGGNLTLDTPVIATGSDLTVNVGSGTHRLDNLNTGTGDININGLSGTVNQFVTAEGSWTFDALTVAGIDTFTNNATLNGTSLINIETTDDIVLNDGSITEAERIILNAGNDVTATGIVSGSDTRPSVTIRAGGDLIDGGDTNVDFDVLWFDSVELDIAGTEGILESSVVLVSDIGDVGSEIASVSDTSILTIEDESESTNPLDGADASVGSLPKSRVDVFLPQCSGNNKNCRKRNALRKFLSALMIGGAIPES